MRYENEMHRIQTESAAWREKNFGESGRNALAQLAGMTEELGELAHSVLKMQQGIRGSQAQHLEEASDALGDIFIYACGLASALNLAIDQCIIQAWEEVRKRDWVANPQDGKVRRGEDVEEIFTDEDKVGWHEAEGDPLRRKP